ncbi:hypothetical protein XFF6166_390059 [Xanthomonas citri pv. fuscans]|nr:hypothetical protein XFF6166_390059 [Xanthomonas citri pv. fuscans]SON99895.1 hypothetical protein XFF6960_210058 [Xanthomonas citri pv. fuscans]SOO10469.1 hypothetical protein XFF6970_570059 [Xanthomonas citri pv. fuscans]SOO15081.1 hypothetical protein XFF7766_470059 [Xanthomonas citri pv. fuscans]SOO44431.1 hypothetical protein XFF1815_530058 [Xanthomonas citri pv. fuscans]
MSRWEKGVLSIFFDLDAYFSGLRKPPHLSQTAACCGACCSRPGDPHRSTRHTCLCAHPPSAAAA